MIKIIDSNKMGRSSNKWLDSHFHFSFAGYRNKDNINFGVLRVINDDLISGNYGFDLHPHRDFEIVSYVIDGKLTHGDSMGNEKTIGRGEGQFMSAGTGVYHSEKNKFDETVRLLQIWVFPDKNGYEPAYGDFKTTEEERKNRFVNIVSGENYEGKVKVHQDVNIYVAELEKDKELDFELKEGRQAYLVQIEGSSMLNDKKISERDGAEVYDENSIKIKALEKSHYLIVEMKKDLERL